MTQKSHSLDELVEEQVGKWKRRSLQHKAGAGEQCQVITISREPGTGGRDIANKIAVSMGMDFMSGMIIQKVAESLQMSEKVVASLDEKNIRRRDDWLVSLFESRHLWPDVFLRHLTKVIATIGRHGNAVILGRGANYILPLEETFRVRLIAPIESRIAKVMADRGSSRNEAEEYVRRTDSDRNAFIRKYFHVDVSDPAHYDLIIDTSRVGIDGTAETINQAYNAWKRCTIRMPGADR